MSKYGEFSRPYFLLCGLNTEIYELNARIQSAYGKIRTIKNSVFGHFSRSAWQVRKNEESVNKGNELGALFCDLAKAFEYTDQKLLVVKLFWYRSSPSSLNLIFSYLSNRTQSVKIKTIYSDKSNIECRIPRNSVIGPLLFNIDLIDPFFGCDDS